MLFSLMAMVCVLTLSAQSIYDFKVKNDVGQDVSLSDYKGKVLLIVNTATRCGFTPQYKELETLYEKYRSEGLEILDFPCNQFGQQAPGTIQEIHQFCSANFDIQFPQFDKIEVNGANEHPLYTWLKAQKGFSGFDVNDQRGKMMDGMLRKQDADYDKGGTRDVDNIVGGYQSDIKWNFTKFLVSRDGRVLKRYEPTDKMTDIEADICMEMNPDEQPDAKPRDASKVKYIK
jgi:glutathione peroxidase-family protein